ncbi:hypothetical protein JCM10212_007049 [Sporobolomyces blumeae]
MGVHGLTSYVNKHPSLASTVVLPPAVPLAAPIPLILDGLAWTYHIGLIDPLRGGNYAQLAATVARHIAHWRACGLEPEFVWDGPFDTSKLRTVINRSEQSLQRTLTYMKSGDGARNQPAIRKAASRLPPFTHQTISAVLEDLGVTSHCAEGEGDSPTAELAQRRNGFVVSNDSDYFIFNSHCLGYVPLQSITYGAANDARLERVHPSEAPRMQFLVYRFETIAASLRLVPHHLPIFAALLGNDLADFASELCLPRKHFFPGRVEPQEVQRIARALATSSPLPATTMDEIAAIVANVVPNLLSRPPSDPDMVAKLAFSAHAYRLLPIDISHPTFPLNPQPTDSPSQAETRALYLSAYKSSRLSSFVIHILKHKTVVLQGSLEMTEYQSPVVYLGRPIRQMIYSVLDHVVGVDSPVEAIMEYCRRGEQLNPTSVPIPPIETYLPQEFAVPRGPSNLVLGLSRSERFSVYLHLLQVPPTLSYSPSLPIIAALSHLILHCPENRQWSPHDLVASVLTSVLLLDSSVDPLVMLNKVKQELPNPRDPPRKEFLQLSAEWLACLVWINTLAQVLLLGPSQPQPPPPRSTPSSTSELGSASTRDREGEENPTTTGPVWRLYDGNLFHSLLEFKPDRLVAFLSRQNERVKIEVARIMSILGEVKAERDRRDGIGQA